MKNIRFLNWALIVFMGLSILGILLNFYMIWEYPDLRHAYKLHGYMGYVNIPVSLIFLYALFQIQQSLAASVQSNIFSFKSAVHLKRGGYVLLVYTVLATIRTIIEIQFLKTEMLLEKFSGHAVFYIISIGLLAVADIIKNGTYIKTENDLTI